MNHVPFRLTEASAHARPCCTVLNAAGTIAGIWSASDVDYRACVFLVGRHEAADRTDGARALRVHAFAPRRQLLDLRRARDVQRVFPYAHLQSAAAAGRNRPPRNLPAP